MTGEAKPRAEYPGVLHSIPSYVGDDWVDLSGASSVLILKISRRLSLLDRRRRSPQLKKGRQFFFFRPTWCDVRGSISTVTVHVQQRTWFAHPFDCSNPLAVKSNINRKLKTFLPSQSALEFATHLRDKIRILGCLFYCR